MNETRDKKGRFIKGVRASRTTEFKKGQHWREAKAHWGKDWLYQKYVVDQLSCAEIAESQQCTEANILYWLRKHGIERRSIQEVREIKYWGAAGDKNGMYGRTGEDNPQWKGGITPDRQAVYVSREWKAAALAVRERDGRLCQACGEHKDLQIHHIAGFEHKELRTDKNNLILLCRGCHIWVHSRANTERRFLR